MSKEALTLTLATVLLVATLVGIVLVLVSAAKVGGTTVVIAVCLVAAGVLVGVLDMRRKGLNR